MAIQYTFQSTNFVSGVGFGSKLDFIDLDGDGDLDAVSGQVGYGIKFFQNNGNATFTEKTGVDNPFSGIDLFKPFGVDAPPYNRYRYNAVAIGNIDGDANRELVIIAEGKPILFAEEGADGKFTLKTGAANPFNSITSGAYPDGRSVGITFEDLDTDGDLDLIFGETNGTIRFLTNSGGNFTEQTGAANPFNGIVVAADAAPAFTDIDQDGDLDLFVGQGNGNIRFFENGGSNNFTENPAANPFASPKLANIYAKPSFGDYDGDGDEDFFIGEQSPEVGLFKANRPATIAGIATAAVTEDASSPNLTATGSLTVNDPDAGQNIFNTSVTSATGNLGSLTITSAGAYSYSVANSAVQSLGAGQTKINTFTVRSIDGTASQQIVVTINGVNDAPTGSPTATLSNTAEDTAITITAANLLAGFSDVDAGNTLSVVNLTATNGALVNNNNGTYTFTPTANFNGVVNLTYGVTDGTASLTGQTRSFTVTPVNDAPTGSPTATLSNTAEDTAITITAADLLAGFSDVDGDTLSVVNLTATNGALVNNNNGTYTFTPTPSVVLVNNNSGTYTFTSNPNFNGVANLTYGVTDGTATLANQTRSFSVTLTNPDILLTGSGYTNGDVVNINANPHSNDFTIDQVQNINIAGGVAIATNDTPDPGDVNWTVGQQILFNSGSSLTTTTGNINLLAKGLVGVDSKGIWISSSNITTANGTISLTGTGSGAGGANIGVFVQDGQIQSTGTATVTVNGTGSSNGQGYDYGVGVSGANTAIRSTIGNINVTGTGGGTGDVNFGVVVESGGKIESTGTAAINVTGQGSTTGTGNDNDGIRIQNGCGSFKKMVSSSKINAIESLGEQEQKCQR